MAADGDEGLGAWCGCGDPHVNDVQELYDAPCSEGVLFEQNRALSRGSGAELGRRWGVSWSLGVWLVRMSFILFVCEPTIRNLA